MSDWGDCCLTIFGDVYERGAMDFPPGAHVLEIGCAEADWITPMLAKRPDLRTVGIDWRRCERPGVVLRQDILTTEFPGNTFDVIVGISSIEHIGLSHYDSDPPDVDGDTHCMERVVQWLKPGGWFYADVPYGTEYSVQGTSHRVYDDQALRDRLIVPGLVEKGRWFTAGSGLVEACDLPAGQFPYVALLLEKA